MLRRDKSSFVRAIAGVAIAGLIAAGCGDDGDTDTGGTGDQSPAGQTVSVAGLWSGAEQANFQRVLDEFGRRTGATVSYTSTGDNIAAVLGARVQGGNPPDVALLPQPGLLRDFARQGALVALPNEVRSKVQDNYGQTWTDLGTVNGQPYGVFFKAANKSIMWYTTSLFEQAGVREPETWEQLLERARTISAFGVRPISVGGADGWTLTDWFENVYLRTAGPERYDQLINRQLPWTDQTVKDALSRLAQIWGDPALLSGGPGQALQTTFPQSVTRVFTDPPQAAIVFEGDFVAGVITAETTTELGEGAGFFAFPAIGGSRPSVVTAGDVAVMMRDTPGARALVDFLASPESAEIWARQGGFLSANEKLDLDVYPNSALRDAARQLVNADVIRFDLSDQLPPAFGSTPGQGMWKALQDFLANPSNVDGTAQTLESLAAAAR